MPGISCIKQLIKTTSHYFEVWKLHADQNAFLISNNNNDDDDDDDDNAWRIGT